MIQGGDIAVIAIMCGSVVALAGTVSKVVMNRVKNAPRIPPEVVDRLTRMEQAIDSIAVEVERISEGQRFTTKLLSEKTGVAERSVVPGER